jgi:two-component system cell cycle response regulator CtrA
MRVLLIEDDSATAQSIELMLKSESLDLRHAQAAQHLVARHVGQVQVEEDDVVIVQLPEEGVDLGKLYDYDIILLDLNLPDMSGYEVLRSLRSTGVRSREFSRPVHPCGKVW